MDLAVPRRRQRHPATPRSTRWLIPFLALVALGACADVPSAPTLSEIARPSFSDAPLHQVFTSGSHVDTWNAIVPVQDPGWPTTVCVPTPAVGLGANWTNPHKAFVANGAAFRSWTSHIFTADWINAWPGFEWYGLTAAYGGPPGSLQQSWTRYSTPVSGNGEFVLYLAADNCSWIYISDEDGSNPQLVGVQLGAPWVVPITYPVTLSGNHRLEFLVFDGGGQSGGMFKLETNSNVVFADTDGDGLADVSETNVHGTNPNDPDTDDDGVNDGDEVAAGTDPKTPEVSDSDGDGVGDNADEYDNSNTGPDIMVGACNTGVANWHFGNGTWANDLIAAAYASAANHGAFVRAVTALSNGWKKSGLITGREHGAIVSCAARTK